MPPKQPLTILWGHRGTGKTSLLKRLGADPKIHAFDLDAEIEKRTGSSVIELFAEHGESHFRELERQTLETLDREAPRPAFVAVGAGFVGKFPNEARTIWIRRESDEMARVFADRPRLDPSVAPDEEYLQRQVHRQRRYENCAQTLTLPEGWTNGSEAETDFFFGRLTDVGGAVTLTRANFRELEEPKRYLDSRARWGTDLFELRDDFLEPDQIMRAASELPPHKTLFSFRAPGSLHRLNWPQRLPGINWDWPLELGSLPEHLHYFPDTDSQLLGTNGGVISLHKRFARETVDDAAVRLEKGGGRHFLKFCPVIENFAELEWGHRWFERDPGNRTFLPRSKDGRWQWYRLFAKGRSKLNFWREGVGVPDQPVLLDWVQTISKPETFAAILGSPVSHSRTPAEQSAFFHRLRIPVYRIAVTRDDVGAGAIEVLQRLGLRYAAVTSPLKEMLADKTGHGRAINTLCWWDNAWHATNTDGDAMAVWLRDIAPGKTCAVWGGGGTLENLKAQLPAAHFYSARTGLARTRQDEIKSPEVLVWASGDLSTEPPKSWRPKTVFDLAYTQHSPAIAYAFDVGARYVSGAAMFEEQAKGQRAFWTSFIEDKLKASDP